MTRDKKIIEDWNKRPGTEGLVYRVTYPDLLDLIRRVRLDEREECANVADNTDVCTGDFVHSGEYGGFSHRVTCPHIGTAIRNRKDEP